ncbi:diacylglycerol/lipid kinase family protein [Halobacteriales archaeon Cl-PHB]
MSDQAAPGRSGRNADEGLRVVVLNPVSGSEDHRDRVRAAAERLGYEVRETEAEGDGVDLASAAADEGATVVAAAGGDGTINEVVRGLCQADALDDVLFGAIPAGTGNNFASNVGVESIEAGFAALEEGERRAIDLGKANGRPFVNSCIVGLTATASAETDPDQKERLGILAYVVTTLEAAVSFDGIDVTIDTDAPTPNWSGEAVLLFVGNARQPPVEGRTQANVEDGRLDVTVVEQAPTATLAGKAALLRFLGDGGSGLRRLQTPSVSVTAQDGETMTVSLDGEILETDTLEIETLSGVLTLAVGSGYDPSPGE